MLPGELDFDGADILADGSEVEADSGPAGVHLLRVDPIFGVQILHLPVGEHPVELIIDLVFRPEPGSQSKALLLPGQLQQVRTLPHDGGAARRHLEHLLLGRVPRDHVELLHLSLAEEPAGAAAEDRRWGVGVQPRRGEPGRGFGCHRGFLRHGADGAVGDGGGAFGGLESGELGYGLLPWRRDAVDGDGGGEEGGLGCHGHWSGGGEDGSGIFDGKMFGF